MSLTVCSGCRRHVREGDGCPFCGARSGTAAHFWKAAVFAAMMPLGLAGCSSETPTPVKPAVTEAKPEVHDGGKPAVHDGGEPEAPAEVKPEVPEAVELGSAVPDPSGHDPGDSEPVDSAGGDSSTPEGTETPIEERTRPRNEEKIRPAKKYGAPPRPKPRPKTKYGGPPRP